MNVGRHLCGTLVLDGVDLLAPSRLIQAGTSGFVVDFSGSTIEITRHDPIDTKRSKT